MHIFCSVKSSVNMTSRRHCHVVFDVGAEWFMWSIYYYINIVLKIIGGVAYEERKLRKKKIRRLSNAVTALLPRRVD